MRRLPGILLLTVATLVVVIVALLVSGLRLVLPASTPGVRSCWRRSPPSPALPVDASQITASWQTFGPTLDARDIHVGLKRWRHNGGQSA